MSKNRGKWDIFCHLGRKLGFADAVVARSTFPSQKCKKTEGFGSLLDVQMSFCVAGARDCAPCQKRISKNDGRRGIFEEDLQRCKFRGRRGARDMFIRAVRCGPGADILRGVTFWSIRSSGLLR
jgi:hypothetical protein